MRIVVVGATGNVGTSLLGRLSDDPDVTSVVGVARRMPELRIDKVDWVRADVGSSDLEPIFRGADVVVHLAWLIQPSHQPDIMRRVNLIGTERLLDAVARAGVPSLVYASSIGAYSPGPKHDPVDESWPTDGIITSSYSRHKAMTERMLDSFEAEHPDRRVVRLRPGLTFKHEAASGIARLFLGPLVPTRLLRPKYLPLIPRTDRLVLQVVHSYDIGAAYHLAIMGDARGPFNVAADPILDARAIARTIGARTIPVPEGLVRGAAAMTWRLGLQPTPPGWVDLAFQSPTMDTTRAREVLGWEPRYTAEESLREMLEGLAEQSSLPTPPLAPRGSPASEVARTVDLADPGSHMEAAKP